MLIATAMTSSEPKEPIVESRSGDRQSDDLRSRTLPRKRSKGRIDLADRRPMVVTKTIGMVRLACCNAWTIEAAVPTIRSGDNATSSAASARFALSLVGPLDHKACGQSDRLITLRSGARGWSEQQHHGQTLISTSPTNIFEYVLIIVKSKGESRCEDHFRNCETLST
jgi:hypothetical protein